MDKQIITKQAVYQALNDYLGQYKSRPWTSIAAFFIPALGSILVFFVPPLIVAKIIDILVANNPDSLKLIGNYVLIFIGLWLIGEVLWRIGLHFAIKLEAKGINNLCKIAFHRLAKRDYDFYANNFVGSLAKKALSFSRSFEMFTDTILFNITTNILPIIFAVIILWRYSPWIPLILIFCLAATIAVAIPIIRRRSKLVALRHDAGSKLAGRLSDILTNILTIKSFAKENNEYRTYKNYIDDYSNKFKKAADFQNQKFDTIIAPIYVFTNVVGLITAIYFTQKFDLQPSAIVVVFSYYSLVTRIFWEINRVYRNLESAISEASEFTQLFLDPPAVQDAKNAKDLKLANADIQFQKVKFKYKDNRDKKKELFLDNFNLNIKSKQKIGLVGASGGGKTTIAKLLLRFADLHAGKITIDGQNISKITQASLREAVSYVPQEPLLFHRSLLENIAYGNENATEKEVIQAAKLAHADEFITKLPLGYQTLVGERGIKLSGGQRQRVAIARAILKNSPILVLDEATSSLDSESEKYIQDGLLKLIKNKTALVIAHRLSTIKHLDRIIVLNQGEIVQDGTHEELIKQKGLYAKLWSHQSGEFLED